MRPIRDDAADLAASWARWAGALLALTVVVGTWMRAAFLWPSLALGLSLPNAVHAHSHVAFFGWVVMGIVAALLPSAALDARRARRLRALAPVLGALSLAAMVAFAAQGYGAAAIAISALHVLAWVVVALTLWPLERATGGARTLMRGALAFLLVAGAATVLPGVLKARGVEDGWLRELGIKLFLTAFIHGFIGMAVMGLVVARIPRPRLARAAAWLTAAGALPSALLHVATPAPAPWIPLAGRAAVGLVGLGTLLFAVEALRARLPALLRGAALAALLVGALEALAAVGVGGSLMHGRPVVVAFLHLLLLGVATPVLIGAVAPRALEGASARPWAVALEGGLALMLAALVIGGWPWLMMLAMRAGLGVRATLALALAGGVVSAAAVLALLLRRRGPLSRREPAREPAAAPALAHHSPSRT
jgi:hypothetical protein